jgi:SgrR family transcriptional regulator
VQLMSYYIDLRTGFEPGVEGRPIRITLDELAAKLFCTTRNVKLLLKKMSEHQWITWSPGLGRGNASELTFHIPADEMISKEAMELAQKGDFNGAIELIHRLGATYSLKASFVDWLYSYFGFKADEGKERQLDTLRFPVYSSIASLDPAFTFYGMDCNVMNQIFDTLVIFNSEKQSIEPHLAHYWELNEDRTVWTFYLRKGVMFHHGRELTAEDVRFSLMRLRELGVGSSLGWLVEGIEEIQAVTRYTFKIRLKQPNMLFLKQLTFTAASIVPEDICKGHEDIFGRLPIGTGPFRVERHDDFVCKLKAFDGYFRVRPHLDQVEIWFLPEDMTAPEHSANSIHVAGCGYDGRVHQIDHSSHVEPEWQQIEQMLEGSSMLTFNTRKLGPQQNLLFRRAVDLVIGRERMIQELGGNRIAISSHFLPRRKKGPISPLDLKEAKRLLDEMKYTGEPLLFYLSQKHIEDAMWIRNQCALVGIPVNVAIIEHSKMMNVDTILEANMILHHEVLETDYDLHIIQILKQCNSYVRACLNDELAAWIDEKIAELLMDESEEERAHKLDALLDQLKEHKIVLFLLHSTTQTSYHSSIKGVKINDLGWVDFRKLWFAPNSPINQANSGNTPYYSS